MVIKKQKDRSKLDLSFLGRGRLEVSRCDARSDSALTVHRTVIHYRVPVRVLHTNKKITAHSKEWTVILAGVEGLEPSQTVLETGVLPLTPYPYIKMVDQQGLEPRTNRLWAGCSNQLSYWSTYLRLATAKVIIHLFFYFVNKNLQEIIKLFSITI